MNNELANIIKRYRKEKNYSQQQLADLVGVSKPYINKIEHGKTIQPSIQLLSNLSAVLNINYTDLIEAANYEIEDVLLNQNIFNDFINRYEISKPNIITKYIKGKSIDIEKVIKDFENEKINNIDATYLFISWIMKQENKR